MKRFIKYIADSNIYGKLILLMGLLVTAPLVVLPFYPEDIRFASAFLIPAVLSVLLGIVICVLAPSREQRVTEWQSPLQRGSLPVLFAWCLASFLGAIPFVLGGQLRFSLALFESVSGWTTTGLTVVDVTALPKIFLFHRSFMQYCGGLGFIIMIAMLIHWKQAMSLYSAEGHPDGLMPSLRGTSRAIFLMYNGFLVAGALLYRIFGMDFFDAVCHTMSALSTAGFTTQAHSIGTYDSLPIEMITSVLTLIGATNFAILLLLVRRDFRQMFRITELRFMFGLLLVFVPLTAMSLFSEMGLGIGESFRHSLFGVITVFTTTGYSTMAYDQWPAFAVGLLILLMLVGGGTGATAGGIKLLRVYLLIRITRENIHKRLSPRHSITAPSYYSVHGKTPIDAAVVNDTIGFVACYMGVFIVGTLLLTLTADCSLLDAMYEFASALGTIGISNGVTSPDATLGTLIVEMAGMLLGRLEIFIVFIGIYAGTRTLKSTLKKVLLPGNAA